MGFRSAFLAFCVVTLFHFAVSQAQAQLFDVGLFADDVNSDLGLQDPKADLVAFTLDDPFAYDPNAPTSTSPVQDFMVENNYHASGAPSGGVANLFYNFTPIPSVDSFVVDLWGRINTAFQSRDDNFDVLLRSGGFDGSIVASQLGLGIPDGDEAYLRVSFDQVADFDTIEIAANDVFFTLMETRAAVECDPLVDCSVPGDVDGNRIVDEVDGGIIAANFYQSVSSVSEGDLFIDGIVDFQDFRIWKREFTAIPGNVTSLVVPEPSAVLLFLHALVCLVLSRYRFV